MTNIEGFPEPSTQDKIVDFAYDVLHGHDNAYNSGSPSHMKGAFFYIGDYDKGERVPMLKLTVPEEAVAHDFAWRAELVFAFQDSTKSKHLLIRNDGDIVLTPYDGEAPRTLTDDQSQELLDQLLSIEDSLVIDL